VLYNQSKPLKSNLINNFYLSSFFSPLVELLCLFVSYGGDILIFSTWHMAMKNTRITRILCLCSSMVVWLLGFDLKKDTKMRRRIYQERKNESMWGIETLILTLFLALMALHMSSSTSKQIYFISNLGPNNEPRNAQISDYWHQDFWALTPRVT